MAATPAVCLRAARQPSRPARRPELLPRAYPPWHMAAGRDRRARAPSGWTAPPAPSRSGAGSDHCQAVWPDRPGPCRRFGLKPLVIRSASNPGWHRGYRRAVQVPPRTRDDHGLTSHLACGARAASVYFRRSGHGGATRFRSTGADGERILTSWVFGAGPAQTPGIVSPPTRPPHPPAGQPGSGPQVAFARSDLTTRWGPGYASLLELAEACGVPVRWSCRTGVRHTCETAVMSGAVSYAPDLVDDPADGSSAARSHATTSSSTCDHPASQRQVRQCRHYLAHPSRATARTSANITTGRDPERPGKVHASD